MTWLITRLAAMATPLLAKAIVALGTSLLLVSAIAALQTARVNDLRLKIDLSQAQAQAAAATAKATVDVLNAERAAAEQATQDAIADALAQRAPEIRTITRTVERIAREDPQFAAARRPAELHALRVQQLRDVDEANGHRLPR